MCVICQSEAAIMQSVDNGGSVPTVLGSAGWLYNTIPGNQVNEVGDAAANTSTNASMEVGEYFNGSIDASYDSDWIAIEMEAGETYVISMYGTNGGSGLYDTTLVLYDENGNELASNDDAFASGDNYFSQVPYTPTSSGTYYIAANGYGNQSGDYTIMAATDVYTVEQVATQITEFGWGVPIAMRFDIAAGGTITYNITGLTAEGRQLAEWAFEAWSSMTGINFVASTSPNASIILDDEEPGAYAGPNIVNETTGIITQSSVNISTSWLDAYGTTLDSYSFLTYVHEIGHALGLSHSGEYDGQATFDDASYLNDSYQMTVMSYFSNDINTYISATDYLPITPMIADIYAIASVYGAVDVNVGDTVWGVNSNVGGNLGEIFAYLFDGEAIPSSVYAGGEIGFTIADSGGTDVIDVSTISDNQVVDLREGGIGSIAGGVGNMVIAIGTIIENAIGGSGNDTITGNDAANTLIGGVGSDRLYGGNGNDSLVGSAGADRLYGGNGNDSLVGSAGADLLYGRSGNDRLVGGKGDDRLYGGDGGDRLVGGNHSDVLIGGRGSDIMIAGIGSDKLIGGAGNDVMRGGTGSDRIYGGIGNDQLFGGLGRDKLIGGSGNDTMTGSYGADIFVFKGSHSDDIITDFSSSKPDEYIDLSAISAITGMNDLINNHMTQSGGNTVIDTGSGTITLVGVDMNDLDQSDFLF